MKLSVISSGIIHPSIFARHALKRFLDVQADLNIQYLNSIERIALEHSASDAILLYFHLKAIPEALITLLENYLSQGGGILALHSASASAKTQPAWRDLLGGKFLHHGNITRYRVEPVQDQHVFDPMPGFEVYDELYIHQYDGNNQVHFFTRTAQGNEPVVWTKTVGRGKLCYIALGHDAGVFKLKPVQQIVRQGLDWVSGMEARSSWGD